MDGKLSCPAIFNDHDSPKAILRVAPPLQDGFDVEGDFSTSFVKEYLTTHITKDSNGEEIVDEAMELMS